MTEAQVVSILGPPDGADVVAEAEAVLGGSLPAGYSAQGWHAGGDVLLLVTYKDGKVVNLQAYAKRVGPTPASGLACPAFRT
jgi:hypothetical protein